MAAIWDSGDTVAGRQATAATGELWAAFGTATSREEFLAHWLALLCAQVGGVRAALLLTAADEANTFAAGAVWPDPQRDMSHLGPPAQQALAERRGIVHARPGAVPGAGACVAYPVEVAGELQAALVLDLVPRPEAALQQALRQVHWASAWLTDLRRQQLLHAREQALERLALVDAVLAALLQEEALQAGALAAVNLLAQRLGCDRVSLGLVHGDDVRLAVISHSADFDRRTELAQRLTEAMEEALDATATLRHPAEGDDALLAPAQARLAAASQAAAVLSLPLPDASGPVGVLVLERVTGPVFDAATVQAGEVLVGLMGPVVALARDRERGLPRRAWDALAEGPRALFGPRHPGAKLLAAAALGAAVVLGLAEGTHRVSARTVVEGEVQRATVAPFDGYLAEAFVRAGDRVRAGQPMARLDDRELRLEQARWAAEHAQALGKLRQAQAGHDRAAMNVLGAQANQAQAQLQLVEERLTRAQLLAPFDGVVVSGDLRQLVGTPLEQGKVLFETAPLDAWRVVLQVDERDIGWVQPGQRGELALAGLPGESLPFSVQQVTAVASAEGGRNVFRVEARVDGAAGQLRPGMEGVGKVRIGPRRLLWIWSHEAVDWLRLAAWRWWP